VGTGCLLVGIGKALALVPAVELMRVTLPPSLTGLMLEGGAEAEGAMGHLAAVISAATSLGACLGPLGGILMESLPQRRVLGCMGEDNYASGFQWTTFAWRLPWWGWE
jgi:hypothetical protein